MFPGAIWWTDLSNPHNPDFAGDRCACLFSEEKAGSAQLTFSPDKTTKSLLR
jgi:hypothetical protein